MNDQEFIALTNEIVDLEEKRNEMSRKLYKLKKIQRIEKAKRENNKK